MRESTGFQGQFGVIRALLVRDAITRFGHENLGFFWVIGEPLILTVGVMIVWSIANNTHGSVPTATFVLTGYSMLTMYRHMVFGFVHILRRNAGTMFHSNVKFLDILAARGLLETVACLASFFVAYTPMYILGLIQPMREPLVALGAWGLGAWFSFSFGMIIAGISELNEISERFIQPLMYVTIPLTGAFFMLSWTPPQARYVLSFSPLINIMEMFRSSMLSEDVTTYWDANYVATICFWQTVIGLLLVGAAQKHIKFD